MKLFYFAIILSLVGFGSLQDLDAATPEFNLAMDNPNEDEEKLKQSVPTRETLKPDLQKTIKQRSKRTPEDYVDTSNEDWSSKIIDPIEREKYFDVINLIDSLPRHIINVTENEFDEEKRSFSPWGGKRSPTKKYVRHLMWTLKQADSQEPTKRVRFSPWGGKRSANNDKLFTDDLIAPGLPSTYSLDGHKLGKPYLREWHSPLRILGLDKAYREVENVSPIDNAMEITPNGSPVLSYFDMFLKKDGKRKVKFSAWGGKRSKFEESTMDAVLEKLLKQQNKLRYETVPNVSA